MGYGIGLLIGIFLAREYYLIRLGKYQDKTAVLKNYPYLGGLLSCSGLFVILELIGTSPA